MINYHGAESGPIDVRSVVEQFYCEDLSHHLQPEVDLSGSHL